MTWITDKHAGAIRESPLQFGDHARSIVILILIGLISAWLQGCSKAPEGVGARPRIAATIFPLQDIAKNVVGDKMDVVGILPPGASPHTYGPSPRQIKELEGARLVFSIGHGLDDWTDTLVDTLPNVTKVVVDKGISLIHTAEAEHHHEGVNPHYWLSISNAKQIAANISEEVAELDPANAEYYRANLQAYLSQLDSVSQRIEERIGGLPAKKVITFHDAWAYYAGEFGLEIVGAFEPFPGKQPTPRYLAGLHEMAREHDVKALFSEPQLSGETVTAFVGDVGLKLYVLDPLGGSEGRGSYIEMMEYNTSVIAEALSHG